MTTPDFPASASLAELLRIAPDLDLQHERGESEASFRRRCVAAWAALDKSTMTPAARPLVLGAATIGDDDAR